MNFGMDGPQVTGWWVNPKTGDKFNAVDTFFEDNNLLIKTSDGRLLNYNQIQNYIQTNDPNSFSKPEPVTAKDEVIPAEVLSEIEDAENAASEELLIPDDNIYGRPTKQSPSVELGNLYHETEPVQPVVQDFAIIDRALASKSIPDPVANIYWENFPKREIEMLVDVMGISEESIIQYYISKVSVNVIKDMVATGIRDYIKDSLNKCNCGTTEAESEIATTQYVPEMGRDQTSSSATTKTIEVKKKTTKKK